MSGQHSLIDQRFWDAVPAAVAVANFQFIVPDFVVKNGREVAIYITFGPTANAGVVEVEGAHDDDFTGTWVAISTVTFSAGNKCHKVSITGVHKALRIRVSTGIGVGTVTGHICAD